MLFKGPQARRYTLKAVHTQRGTHKSNPPPSRFADPVSVNQPETLAQISGYLIVVAKKTIC